MGNKSSAATSDPVVPPVPNLPRPPANTTTPTTVPTPVITETAPLALDTRSPATPTTATTSAPKMTWATATGKAKEASATTTATKATTSPTSWPNLIDKAKEGSTVTTTSNTKATTPTNWTNLIDKAKEGSTVTTTTKATTPTSWTNLIDKAKEGSTVTTTSATDPAKPTLFTVTQSLTAETRKAKPTSSAYAQWYKYTKFEQEKREKRKGLWYMNPPTASADTSSPTTSTLTTTSAKIRSDTREVSDLGGITAIPSFQLRSTAVYSPPHGDRFLPGRNPLRDTETIPAFKYYITEYTLTSTTNDHTRATMYQMDTISRQAPRPNQPFSSPSAQTTRENTSLPTVVSRGIQTDLQAQPMNPLSNQTYSYDTQPSQIIPAQKLAGQTSNSTGFYHLPAQETSNRSQSLATPSHPPARQPPSILKNSSTVLTSQDRSNPLSERTHDRALEELRQQNKDSKDGLFRIKKVHLLEKNDPKHPPPAVPFSVPPQRKKASQSISRSERLFSSRSFKQKI